ncbi:RHS repeat-associated core domain-containing protein [Dokdonella sp.]|uniref:RHS repeat-associated core domain-containing protein n=2 Tax=Dokdonella sp. TaxID=2291710 RepID=UPI0027B908BB|nr:RHS repeat-associated core domain-containing protein [Dokdonella sp.]
MSSKHFSITRVLWLFGGLVLSGATFGLSATQFARGAIGSGNPDPIFADSFELTPANCVGGQADADGDGLLDLACVEPFMPPDPSDVAPPIDSTVITDFSVANDFIHAGTTPIQRGVNPATIQPYRMAILRGRVFDGSGQPLPGALVRVLDHPEFGYTFSRPDGRYDIAVNGGGEIVADYQKAGFLRAQRRVTTPWQDWVLMPDAALVPLDSASSTIVFNATVDLQVHRASAISDSDGDRRATLLFPAGIRADMVALDGSRTPVSALTVRATEYTVGPNGPARMPAVLPATSGYTYAVELSADEALQAGAKGIEFDRPVVLYYEDYLGFPVGARIPVGYYDFRLGSWLPSPDGRVVRILGDANGLAALDIDGSGQAADAAALAALGIDEAERAKLLALYPIGQVLWRSAATHFTPWDCNFPFGPPPDAEPPQPPADPPGEPDPPEDPTNPPNPNDPPDDNPDGPEDPDPCETSGSIIDCSNADLGEDIAIAGTDLVLNYRSNRMRGANPQRFRVRVNVTGAAFPPLVKKVHVRLTLGGYHDEFTLDPPVPNYYHEFNWNGLDAYKRRWQGEVRVKVEVGYVYDGVYYASSDAFVRSFGSVSGQLVTGDRVNREIAVWSSWFALGAIAGRPIRQNFWDATGLGLGGWSVSGHDVLDPANHILYAGDGTTRRLGTGASASLVVAEPYGELPEIETSIMATGPDGTVYKVVTPNEKNPRERLTMQRPGQSPQVLAYSCPAAEEGREYCGVDPSSPEMIWQRARRLQVDSLGRIVLVAEDGVHRFAAPSWAVQHLFDATNCAIPEGGQLFEGRIVFTCGAAIHAVWPDGQVTPLTSVIPGPQPRKERASAVPQGANFVDHLTIAANGDMYFVDTAPGVRIRKLSATGLLSTVIGNDTTGFTPDGAMATGATISYPTALRALPDGRLLFADQGRIREIGPNGQLRTLVGGGDEIITAGQNIGKRTTVSPTWIDQLPDGSVLFNEAGRIYRVDLSGRFSFGNLDGKQLVPAPDGRSVGEFDVQGRHLRTLDAVTGAVLRGFEYNATGHLIGIVDRAGNRTRIEWNGAQASAIVSPYGVRTELAIGADGLLRTVANAENHQWKLDYHGTLHGLLARFERPGGVGHASTFDWDLLGRLLKDTDSEGGFTQLDLYKWAYRRVSTGQTRTALERERGVGFSTDANGDTYWSRWVSDDTNPASRVLRRDGREFAISSRGLATDTRYDPDPRFGLDAAYPSTQTISMPLGPTVNRQWGRSVSSAGGTPGLGAFDLSESTTINQRTRTSSYQASARAWTFTTPEQRSSRIELDSLGRPARMELPAVPAMTWHYDARGRLHEAIWGEGAEARHWIYGYDDHGYLKTLTNPLDQTVTLTRDSIGRVLTQELPDQRIVGFDYDAEGNVTSIVPPGRPAHGFRYNSLGAAVGYDPPTVPGSGSASYAWNLDRQSSGGTDADGRAIAVGYAADRFEPQSLTTPQVTRTYGYEGGGRLSSIVSPAGAGNDTTSVWWAGPLVRGQGWVGAISGSVEFEYDPNLWLHRLTVRNGSVFATQTDTTFDYDNDGLLLGTNLAGASLAFTRDAASGRLTGSTLGVVTDAWTYSAFGEPATRTIQAAAAPVLDFSYTHDKLGRIVHKVETTPAGSHVTDYGYDLTGRLETIQRDGVLAVTYVYDANGNRLHEITPGGTTSGSYDDQDRQSSWGSQSFQWNASGQLASRIGPDGTTSYAYDALGNLRSVALPGGASVEYVIDGLDRRVGRKENGVLTRQYLYKDGLKPVAELDGNGELVALYAYAEWSHAPSLMLKGGKSYRIVSDHLGSPRRVIDSDSGAIVQALDYDEWGNVLADSNPGFQPFGFAGGLYDPATKLLRFGARDYDPSTGRWTAKDPIGFGGGDANLYAYAASDPINRIDPDGLRILVLVGGPTNSNPFGHVAVAVTGSGVFSFGTGTPPGSSVTSYLLDQAKYRDTTAYIISSPRDADQRLLDRIKSYPENLPPVPGPDSGDTCASRTNRALMDAGYRDPSNPYAPFFASPLPESTNAIGQFHGGPPISIPAGTLQVPVELEYFNP